MVSESRLLKAIKTILTPSCWSLLVVCSANIVTLLFYTSDSATSRAFALGYLTCSLVLCLPILLLPKAGKAFLWGQSIAGLESDRHLAFLEGWRRHSEMMDRCVEDCLYALPKDRVAAIIKEEMDQGEIFVKTGQHLNQN